MASRSSGSNRRTTTHQSVYVPSRSGSVHQFSLATLQTSKLDAAQELEAKTKFISRSSAAEASTTEDEGQGKGKNEFENDLSTSFPFGPEVNPCCGSEVPCKSRVDKHRGHGGNRIPSVIRKQRHGYGFQRPGLGLENKFRVRMKSGTFHHEPIEYIAEVPPRAPLRLEYITGTNKVRLNDRKYMHQLHHGLIDVEQQEIRRKQQEREIQEEERVKKLVINGAMIPTPDLEYLYDHPAFRVNEMLRRLQHHDSLLAQPPPPNKFLVEVDPFEYNSGAFFRYLHRTGRTDWAPKAVMRERLEKLRGKVERARERKRQQLAEMEAGGKDKEGVTQPHTLETLYKRSGDEGQGQTRVSWMGPPRKPGAVKAKETGPQKKESSSDSWETITDSESGSEYTNASSSEEEVTPNAKAKSAKSKSKAKGLGLSAQEKAEQVAASVSTQLSRASQRGFVNPAIMEDLRQQKPPAKTETPAEKEARLRKLKACYGIKSNEKLHALAFAASAHPSKAQKAVLGCLEGANNTEELFECGQSLRRVYLRQSKVADDFCKYLGRFMASQSYKH